MIAMAIMDENQRPSVTGIRRPASGVPIDPDKLRYWRDIVRSMSRLELATRARISQDFVGKIERGERRPKAPIFKRLYLALGVGPEDLLTDKAAEALRKLLEVHKKGSAELEELWESLEDLFAG